MYHPFHAIYIPNPDAPHFPCWRLRVLSKAFESESALVRRGCRYDGGGYLG